MHHSVRFQGLKTKYKLVFIGAQLIGGVVALPIMVLWSPYIGEILGVDFNIPLREQDGSIVAAALIITGTIGLFLLVQGLVLAVYALFAGISFKKYWGIYLKKSYPSMWYK